MESRVPFFESLRYFLTKNQRTEEFYRRQYATFFAKYYAESEKCLKIGPLLLPRSSASACPTREDAYYAMEIGDILLPALMWRFAYVDEGPYEWGAVDIRLGDVVFDCGANLGVFSLLAAYRRAARVFAFEPVTEAREALVRALALNPALKERVTIVPCMLGTEVGEAEFTVLPDTLVGSPMVLPQSGRKVRVQVTTVDAFVRAHQLTCVDFLKADIEGAERLMLAGAVQTLRRFSPKVSLCTYHLPDDPEVICGFLRKAQPDYVLTSKWKKVYGHCSLGK